MTGETAKNPGGNVYVELGPVLFERISEHCARSGVPRARLLREIVRQYYGVDDLAITIESTKP